MENIKKLFELKGVIFHNRYTQFKEGSLLKASFIFGATAVLWIILYNIFRAGIYFLNSSDYSDIKFWIIDIVLSVFFLVLFLLLTFSNTIVCFTTINKSKDTQFLASHPIGYKALFMYKLFDITLISSWAFIYIASPLIVVYLKFFEVSYWLFFDILFLFAAFILITASIGSSITILVTSFLARESKHLFYFVLLLIICSTSIFLIYYFTNRNGSHQYTEIWVSRILGRLSFSKNPFLPSYWVVQGMIALTKNQISRYLYYLCLLSSNALFFTLIAQKIAGKFLSKSISESSILRQDAVYKYIGFWRFIEKRVLFFLNPTSRTFILKDLKLFIRNPAIWTQFLVFFGILAIYFSNLKTFGYDVKNLFWRNMISYFNLTATLLTLSTFTSRFIYPQISLEGQNFWMIGVAPINRFRILLSKFFFSFISCLIISEGLTYLSCSMLNIPIQVASLHALVAFSASFGFSGLSLGLGTIYADFKETNPSKIVSGMGGTINLILSISLIITILTIEIFPVHRMRHEIFISQIGNIIWYTGGAILTLGLLAGFIPLIIGLYSFKRKEF